MCVCATAGRVRSVPACPGAAGRGDRQVRVGPAQHVPGERISPLLAVSISHSLSLSHTLSRIPRFARSFNLDPSLSLALFLCIRHTHKRRLSLTLNGKRCARVVYRGRSTTGGGSTGPCCGRRHRRHRQPKRTPTRTTPPVRVPAVIRGSCTAMLPNCAAAAARTNCAAAAARTNVFFYTFCFWRSLCCDVCLVRQARLLGLVCARSR